MPYKIPVAAPSLIGNEKEYVNDCMESGWISSAGKYIELFEARFAEFCGVRHAVACCNGTIALHLALVALGVRQGDEVIVPTLTFVATANAVTYCGATPVFVDSEAETWNLDPARVEAAITPRTKGIIAVHLYGHPAKMDELKEIARRHNLFLLEDAAEAHGASYKGQTIGSIGNAAAFSFYANKIITTGEGGMVVTDDDALAERARILRGQGMDSKRRYWFPVIGYNYRMMNLPAAIGLAQLEKIDEQLAARKRIAALYREKLQDVGGLTWQNENAWARHVYWMFNVVLEPGVWATRDDVMEMLSRRGIETRPVFYPMHSLPPYIDSARAEKFPVAESLARNGISLPTWAGLKSEDIDYICNALRQCKIKV
ncbi:MAG TPA: DegT/DnrJ/EryC1/StrS family aminotransferase [Pyrinomonadaceae bacterium]|jgi:perosamine synthetase